MHGITTNLKQNKANKTHYENSQLNNNCNWDEGCKCWKKSFS